MKGTVFLGASLFVFALLLGAAFAWDSIRIDEDLRAKIEAEREELARIDERIARTEADLAHSSDEATRRGAADEVAGARNRRTIAERRLDAVLNEYREFSDGFRGEVARWFTGSRAEFLL